MGMRCGRGSGCGVHRMILTPVLWMGVVVNAASSGVASGLGEGSWWYSAQAVEAGAPGAASGWSDTRSFQVDRTAPPAPTVSVTGSGVQVTGPQAFTARSGSQVTVSVTPPATDVCKYRWGVGAAPTVEQVYPVPDVGANPHAMWSLNPGPMSWPVTFNQISKVTQFRVEAIDWAGNVSAITEYTVNVTTDEIHRFELNGTGANAVNPGVGLSVNPEHHLNAEGAHYYWDQHPSYGIRTCTDRSYRSAGGGYIRPMVEGAAFLNSQSAFSVSAWVWLDQSPSTVPDAAAGAVAMVQGWPGSVWLLGTHTGTDGVARWAFGVDPVPGDSAKEWVDGPVAATGEWAHVVGTYAPDTGTVRLFVNGTPAGSLTVSSPIGQGHWMGVGMAPNHADRPSAQWQGRVDAVRVFSGELDAGVAGLVVEDGPEEDSSCTDTPVN